MQTHIFVLMIDYKKKEKKKKNQWKKGKEEKEHLSLKLYLPRAARS